ncbi:MAG: DNA-binding protein [Deltaproteobacteria bacterium]|nr:DNA-binding protein [Deltaproteobacteria bacterium]
MDEKLWEKDLWTQQEVSDYFRVVPGTVKNWRDQGLLSYWQAPGSTRVFYFSDEIKDFREKNTIPKKGGDRQNQKTGMKRAKPVVSAQKDKDWRI